MATTGRLTAAQRAAILNGAPIRQTWQIRVPGDVNHTSYQTYPLDDGIYPLQVPEATPRRRVTKAGSRSHVVWNPSPMVTVKPKAVRYLFEVDNHDGVFYENNADNVYQVPSVYQAVPQECQIIHTLFVGEPGTYRQSYTWTEITHMTFTGGIITVTYEDTAKPDGTPLSGSAIITCEQLGAWDALRRDWTNEDGEHFPMTGTGLTPLDYVWEVT